MSKQYIQSFLRRFGYYLRSTSHFGDSLWHDIGHLMPSGQVSTPTFFDVGAHYGETIVTMRNLSPNALIHSFEPDPESFRILSSKAEYDRNVRLHPLALGHEAGTAVFRRNYESMTNSLLPTSTESKSSNVAKLTATTEEIQVQVDTIHAFCQREDIQRIDLLKTDCQGFDLNVLRGAEKMLVTRQIGLVICEMIFDEEYEGQGHAHDILSFMYACDYSLIGFYNMGRNERRECTFCDAIFIPRVRL